MKRAFLALAIVFVMAVGIAGGPSSVQARKLACAVETDIDVAIIGNDFGGAPWGSANGRYGPYPGYVANSAVFNWKPGTCPGGYWTRLAIFDNRGRQVCWSGPVFICPY